MAYKSYVLAAGDVRRNATVSAPTGAETVTATIGVGNIGIIIEDTAKADSNIMNATVRELLELAQESNA
jgi:hypothetical protein